MRSYTFILLALVASAPVMAQETVYKGNPHIIIPDDKPHVSVPFDPQHITLPIPAAEITNVFIRGYQSMLDEKLQNPRLMI